MKKDEYVEKLSETFGHFIESLKNPQILEFGVRHGLSTNLFLKVCENNNGHLYSVDIDDYSSKFYSNNWTFIHGSDDNFSLVEKHIPEKIDLIYIDSFHDAEYVKKIFYHYYNFLKIGGFIFIDDICWLPYAKFTKRESSGNYEANIKTFEKLLEIQFGNLDKFNMEFSFHSCGMAKIIKTDSSELNEPKKIKKSFSIKNFILTTFKKFLN